MDSNPAITEEIRRYEEQYERNPDSLVFARLADAYRKAGDPRRALALLEEGLSRHADYVSGHIVRGRACLDLGRPGAAREAFEEVLRLDAANRVALRSLAELSMPADPAAARSWLSRLVQLDPLDEEARRALASLETEATPPPSGESWTEVPSSEPAAWRELWAGEPELPPAEEGEAEVRTRTMAVLYARQGLFEEAIEICRELLAERPHDAALRRLLEETRARASGEAAPPGREQRRSPPLRVVPSQSAASAAPAAAQAPGPASLVAPRPPDPEADPPPVRETEALAETRGGATAAGNTDVGTTDAGAAPSRPVPIREELRELLEQGDAWVARLAALQEEAPSARSAFFRRWLRSLEE